MNTTVVKLIVKRFATKLVYAIWSSWLSVLIFTLLLGLLMYALSDLECPIRRALGFPLDRSKDPATAFHPHPREQDCTAGIGKPQNEKINF